LNNEKVTLSFRPATPDDEAALQALLPEGEVTDISQLPSSIPSYLIEVIPEFKVNGELKITGAPMALGEELVFNTRIKFPGRSKSENYDYKVIAGSYLSVNVVAGSVSSRKLTDLQANLSATKAILESNEPAQIETLTRQEILGDMFYTGTMGYFAQLNAINQVSGLGSGAQYQLASGYGTFGYEPKVDYLFGFPTAIQPGGVVLDIPLSIVTATNDGSTDNKKNFVMQVGVLSSALEHVTSEQIFNDPLNPIDAISAVKALQIAAAQGQRTYQITQTNIDSVLPLLNLSGTTEAEIVTSVNAGLEVVTHTDQVSVPGYTGEGYIIIDTETGSGAYKIGGGQNGAWISGAILGFSVGLLVFVLINSPAALGVLSAEATVVMLLALVALVLVMDRVWKIIGGSDVEACFFGGVTAAFSLVISISNIPSWIAKILSAVGIGASQLDMMGNSARTCGVV
jgi:hypothetical protein